MPRLVVPAKPTSAGDQLAALRDAEKAVEEMEGALADLRALGRRTLGFGPSAAGRSVPLALRSAGPAALGFGLLAAVATVPSYAAVLASHDLRTTLAIGAGTLGLVLLTAPLAATVSAFGLAAAFGHRRQRVLGAATGAIALALVLIAFTTTIKVLLVGLALGGVAAAAAPALYPASVADAATPEDRVAAFAVYRAAEAGGPATVALLLLLLTSATDLTWRAVVLVLAALAAAGAYIGSRLSLRAPGARDTDLVSAAVVAATGGDTADRAQVRLGAPETARRLLALPTVRAVVAVSAVLGLFSVPTLTYLLFHLEERYGLDGGARAGIVVLAGAAAAVAVLLAVPAAEVAWRRSPPALLRAAATALAVALPALALAGLAPNAVVCVVALVLASAGLGLVRPALDVALMSVAPPEMRPVAGALAGTAFLAAAAFGGPLLIGGLDATFGPGGAVVAAAVIGIQALPLLRLAARSIDGDLDRLVDSVVEDAELRQALARGAHLPMLACRGIDFSYGSMQVLFGVDFTVDDGEMVALLGTNGAGKSTLLRVISGLGLPDRGTVRLRGADISFVDAERRMRLGISQVPGGKGVYPPMTVLENLRVHGYSRGRDRATVESGIDAAFAAFPRLAERRRQAASTLSGGEQQMLAVARALVVRPRLLLIDELSLGLAPKIVGELLESVRRINAEGTAVVLVEQSVNVALSLVDHAYFMEKGEMRFDGRAADLLERPDLLRSVFLEGATAVAGAS